MIRATVVVEGKGFETLLQTLPRVGEEFGVEVTAGMQSYRNVARIVHKLVTVEQVVEHQVFIYL